MLPYTITWHARKVTPGTWEGYCWNKGCDAMDPPLLSFLLEKVLCLPKHRIYWKMKAIEVFETSWFYEGNMGQYQTLRSSSDCLGCGKSRIYQIKFVVSNFGQISGVHSLNYSKVMDQEHNNETQYCLSHTSPIPCQTGKKTFKRREKASFLSLSLSLSVSVCLSSWQSQSGSWLSVSLIMNSWFLLASTKFFMVTSKTASDREPSLPLSSSHWSRPGSRKEVTPAIRILS